MFVGHCLLRPTNAIARWASKPPMKPFFGIGSLVAITFLAGCNASDSPLTGAQADSTTSDKTTSEIARNLGVPQGQKTALGLTVPRGFRVELLAEGLEGPRRLAIAPGGSSSQYDLFVAESQKNRATVLRVHGGKVEQKSVYSASLNQPYGLAFLGNSLYVGNTDAVVRLPYKIGALSSSAVPQKIATLTEGGYNQHWTRNLIVAPQGKKLFVTVGSSCNTCEERDPQRAAISELNPDGSGKKLFASGLRNPVGLAIRPGTNELWTVVNERDNLGDDVPPDYLTQVKKGAFYGWPYAYADMNGQIIPDPSFGATKPEMVKKTTAPTVPVQAHSAALGVAFYPLKGGNFPKEFSGDAFLAFHGSWNRSAKTGYKVVRVDFQNGKPRAVSDFLTGYLKSDDSAWGRPVDVQIAPDGALLVSDDAGGKIWRVSYAGTPKTAKSATKLAPAVQLVSASKKRSTMLKLNSNAPDFSLPAAPKAFRLNDLDGKNRIALLFPRDDIQARAAIAQVEKSVADWSERDLKLVLVVAGNSELLNLKKTPKHVIIASDSRGEVAAKYGVTNGETTFYLLGKNGFPIALATAKMATDAEIFARIDSMPMRQWEMRTRAGSKK